MINAQLYRIIWLSRPLMQAAEASVEKGLAGTGMTVRMRAVLEILNQHGDLTVPDLAEKLDIQRQYVQVMVNETIEAGWTEKHPNPRHKRSSLLRLTPEGHAVISGVMAREMAVVRDIAATFDAEEVEIAHKVVQALTAALRRHAEDAP